jgi:hypothetical protein
MSLQFCDIQLLDHPSCKHGACNDCRWFKNTVDDKIKSLRKNITNIIENDDIVIVEVKGHESKEIRNEDIVIVEIKGHD